MFNKLDKENIIHNRIKMGWNPIPILSKSFRDVNYSIEDRNTVVHSSLWYQGQATEIFGQMMKIQTCCLSHPTVLFSHSYDPNKEQQHFC